MRNDTGRIQEAVIFVMMIVSFMVGILGLPMEARAEETAVFHVQASEVKEDGTIRVSVYLTDTENLGGIDAELVYDPEKVTYVSSGLGRSFTSGFGETNCDEATSTIKCVTVYQDAKAAHGELMYAVFQLNGIESYQPEFRVVDMLDATVELNPVPYTITYQQADGNWTDTRDTSEKAADESVIAQVLEAYGALEDMEVRPVEEGEPVENKIMEEEGLTEEISGQAKSEKNSGDTKTAELNDSNEVSGQGTGKMFETVIGLSVAAVIVIIIIIVRKRK